MREARRKRYFSAIYGVIDRCWPSICVHCHGKSDSLYDLCKKCETQLPLNINACPVCAIPLTNDGKCDCSRLAESIDACYAPLLYQDKVLDLIQRFKYSGQRRYGRLLSHLMIDYLMQSDIVDWPQVLVPVPTHWRRRFLRGFNPSEDLAHDLASHFGIPVAANLVVRNDGAQLSRLSSRKRRIQAAAASYRLKNKHIRLNVSRVAIVDDVVTSGATALSLASLLRQLGVEHVQVWSSARTINKS